MFLLLLALGVMAAGGLTAVLAQRRAVLCTALGAAGSLVGCALGVIPALRVLLGGPAESLRLEWSVPYGAFFIAVDALSAFFVLVIFALSAAAAVYGAPYLLHHREKRLLGSPWFFFNLLVVSMVLVVIARNGVLFLVAWEVMALSSFFLVTFEDEKPSVREAGWVYLVATHLGTAFLLVMFVLLGPDSGALDFDRFSVGPGEANVLFLLALVGFGTKAGLMPFHVWLPEAHPAAPSHVSALMSGVMIKTGIYGLLRVLTFLGPPPPWWGWLLCAMGLISGVGGVLFALAQHDLKRLLAYSSVENIGIITLGLGVGVLGLAAGALPVATLGFAGALLHVVNHACFKGLLFLGAGAVGHATGSLEMECQGGLLKRMPWTGAPFLIGAVAICGLPPLNGFISEWLIYVGGFRGLILGDSLAAVPLLGVIGGLALIGGLAAACFTKAFGIVFLGEPRSERAQRGHEVPPAMWGPMAALALACVAIGLFAPEALRLVLPAAAVVMAMPLAEAQAHAAPIVAGLAHVARAALAVLVMAGGLWLLRHWLLSGRSIGRSVTWDCGYARPSARMQYTASSFVQPLTDLFGPWLRTRRELHAPVGLFPHDASFASATADVCRVGLYGPLFAGVGRLLTALRWLQHGRVHLYVLYITVTLLVLLLWKLG